MLRPLQNIFRQELSSFLYFKETDRLWHIPLLASLCVGIPLLIGLYFNQLQYGLMACLAGLVILYLPNSSISIRMMRILLCSFGFLVSVFVGLLFSFDPFVGALAIGVFIFFVHWISLFLKMAPPGSFFFIMLSIIANCMPHDLSQLPFKLGLVALGTINACILAFIYALLMSKKSRKQEFKISSFDLKSEHQNIIESLILSFFIFLSLLIGRLLKLSNPYWVPITCAAVMQGVSTRHVWQRGLHRIVGTFIGLGLSFFILSLTTTPIYLCLAIMVLQFIIEMLIVRHYGLAVVFITPMTILLTEAGNPLIHDPGLLIPIRFWDILLGTFLGVMGGWVLYHDKLRNIKGQSAH